MRMWRNWQTRWSQEPVSTTWRFKSSHPHQIIKLCNTDKSVLYRVFTFIINAIAMQQSFYNPISFIYELYFSFSFLLNFSKTLVYVSNVVCILVCPKCFCNTFADIPTFNASCCKCVSQHVSMYMITEFMFLI